MALRPPTRVPCSSGTTTLPIGSPMVTWLPQPTLLPQGGQRGTPQKVVAPTRPEPRGSARAQTCCLAVTTPCHSGWTASSHCTQRKSQRSCGRVWQRCSHFYWSTHRTTRTSQFYASPKFLGKSQRGIYGDAVEELDDSVGQLLSAIDGAGAKNDTFVIFSSDKYAQSLLFALSLD